MPILYWINFSLLEALFNQDLKKDFEQLIAKTRKDISNLNIRNATYFYYQSRVEDIWRRFCERHTPRSFSFQSYLNSFNKYRILQELKYSILELHLRNVRQTERHTEIPSDLLKQLKGHPILEENQVIALFYALLELYSAPPQDMAFARVKELLLETEYLLEEKEKMGIYHLLKEYLIRAQNREVPQLRGMLLDWYQLLLEKGYLNTPYLAHSELKNIISLAVKDGKTQWASRILEERIGEVEEVFQNDLKLFCEGAILFYEQKWADAFSKLSQAKPINDFYYYDIHSILLRIAFEQEDDAGFDHEFDNIRKKLDRDKATAAPHLEAYRNFNQLTKQIYYLFEPSTSKLEHLKESIHQKSLLPHKAWLLEKLQVKSAGK